MLEVNRQGSGKSGNRESVTDCVCAFVPAFGVFAVTAHESAANVPVRCGLAKPDLNTAARRVRHFLVGFSDLFSFKIVRTRLTAVASDRVVPVRGESSGGWHIEGIA